MPAALEVLSDQTVLHRELRTRRCAPGCSRLALPIEYKVCNVLHEWLQVGRYGGLEEDVVQLKRDKNVLMMELVRLRRQQEVRSQPTKVQHGFNSDLVSCLQRCCQRCAACFAGGVISGDLLEPAEVAAWVQIWSSLSWCCMQSVLQHPLTSCGPLIPMVCCGSSGHLTLCSRGMWRKGAGLLVTLPCCCRCRRRRWHGCRGAWTPQSSASSR